MRPAYQWQAFGDAGRCLRRSDIEELLPQSRRRLPWGRICWSRSQRVEAWQANLWHVGTAWKNLQGQAKLCFGALIRLLLSCDVFAKWNWPCRSRYMMIVMHSLSHSSPPLIIRKIFLTERWCAQRTVFRASLIRLFLGKRPERSIVV